MSDIDQVLTAVMCNHTAAHHGVAGSPEMRGCDECGATWTEIQPDVEPAPTNPSGGAVTSTPAPSGDTTPEAIRDRVLRDVLNSDAMAALLTTDAFLNAAKWRFLQAGLTILAEQGLLSDPEAVSR